MTKEIRSILVVVDRSASVHPELERALELARAFHARVFVFAREYDKALYAHYFFSKAGDKLSREAYEREAQQWVDAQLETFEAEGIEAKGAAAWQKRMSDAVMDKVREIQPDLVIKSTEHDSQRRRTFFNYTDWELMRHCPAPLLLVKPGDTLPEGEVVCAVNPGHAHASHYLLDEYILRTGEQFAHHLGKSLHVFNSFEVVSESMHIPSGIDAGVHESLRQQAETEHRKLFDEFVSGHELEMSQAHSMTGAPEDTLPPFAKSLPAAMVVMGVVSRSALPTILIGHTAENILERLDCDVLVLKHPDVKD